MEDDLFALKNLSPDDNTTDATIFCREGSMNVHSSLLSFVSPTLCRIADEALQTLSGSGKLPIDLDDIPFSTLQSIVSAMYDEHNLLINPIELISDLRRAGLDLSEYMDGYIADSLKTFPIDNEGLYETLSIFNEIDFELSALVVISKIIKAGIPSIGIDHITVLIINQLIMESETLKHLKQLEEILTIVTNKEGFLQEDIVLLHENLKLATSKIMIKDPKQDSNIEKARVLVVHTYNRASQIKDLNDFMVSINMEFTVTELKVWEVPLTKKLLSMHDVVFYFSFHHTPLEHQEISKLLNEFIEQGKGLVLCSYKTLVEASRSSFKTVNVNFGSLISPFMSTNPSSYGERVVLDVENSDMEHPLFINVKKFDAGAMSPHAIFFNGMEKYERKTEEYSIPGVYDNNQPLAICFKKCPIVILNLFPIPFKGGWIRSTDGFRIICNAISIVHNFSKLDI